MKRMLMTAAIMLFAFPGFAQPAISELSYAPSPFKMNYTSTIEATGTLMLKDGTWIIRVEDRNGFTDYVPTNLDPAFKTESVRVHFKAELQDIPENVRMIGQPVKILTIERVQ